ncbi:hypothetical protein GCM10023336_32910 [Streptomyces similanensis]|uniref:Uncharacterized protein n=1 Tax=Streptomyces similanensis TaxID=1274988 RepID=A0ABP9KH00_9ACTN
MGGTVRGTRELDERSETGPHHRSPEPPRRRADAASATPLTGPATPHRLRPGGRAGRAG